MTAACSTPPAALFWCDCLSVWWPVPVMTQTSACACKAAESTASSTVGAVRTDWPCPQRCLVYYYEVTIANSGERGSIGIGLADVHFHLNRQPGWEPNSYAYHGDGRRYVLSESAALRSLLAPP